MSNSLDQGKKGKKKRKKNPPHLLDMGSPQLSDLGDSTSYREEPIHIEFSAKEPSAYSSHVMHIVKFRHHVHIKKKRMMITPFYHS